MIVATEQLPHDSSLRRWSGRWFKPVVNKYYTVPANAANHPECRGRSGVCIEVRENTFGMFWAVINFFESKEDDGQYHYPDSSVVRTKYLIPCDGRPVK
jgi:hypothetical protein